LLQHGYDIGQEVQEIICEQLSLEIFDETVVGDAIETIEISNEGLVIQMKASQKFGALAMWKKIVLSPEMCYTITKQGKEHQGNDLRTLTSRRG